MLINLIKKLDVKLDLKDINQITILQANRLLIKNLIVVNYVFL